MRMKKNHRGYLFLFFEYNEVFHYMCWKHWYFHKCEAQLKISMFSPQEMKIYRKNSKIWDTSNNDHNCLKNRKVWCNISLMHPKDADGMANSVDPDQTASSEAVWSWSALFAETYLSQYIEFVRYMVLTVNRVNWHLFSRVFCPCMPYQTHRLNWWMQQKY